MGAEDQARRTQESDTTRSEVEMKKKVAMLVLAGLLALTVNSFATKGTPDLAIGAELASVNFGGVGAMMTLHIPNVPLFFGIGADFTSGFTLAMTADYWLLHQQISGMLEWYLGVGAYGAVSVISPAWYVFGVRVPVALQLWPLDNELLELFVEVAPAWVPVTSGGLAAGNFQAQVAVGFRFWP
jgi:hypothetical protein